MRSLPRIALTAVTGAAIATGLTYWWVTNRRSVAVDSEMAYPERTVPTFPDPNPARGSSSVFLDPFEFDNGVFNSAARFTGAYPDESSLHAYREAIAARVPRAKAWLEGQTAMLRLRPHPTPAEIFDAVRLCREGAFIALYEGNHDDAAAWLSRGLEFARIDGAPTEARAHMMALLGINALRRGEQDNCIACVGPSSCIFPIAPGAIHTRPAGSREAVRWFTAYLDEWPGDLRIRWLLNIASMTLGEYPDQVPRAQVIPVARARPARDAGRFNNNGPTAS